ARNHPAFPERQRSPRPMPAWIEPRTIPAAVGCHRLQAAVRRRSTRLAFEMFSSDEGRPRSLFRQADQPPVAPVGGTDLGGVDAGAGFASVAGLASVAFASGFASAFESAFASGLAAADSLSVRLRFL